MMSETEPVLLSYSLSDRCYAFSTTRSGGVSEGNYAHFNVSSNCGDSPSHVAENRRLLCHRLGIDRHRLIVPHQTHGDRLLVLDESFFSQSEADRARALEGVDALLTAVPRVCIGVSTADCVPVLLYASGGPCVAAIHAGWRGTVRRIVSKVVDRMLADGVAASHIRAVIGPSISLPAFEVGDEVYEAFMQAGFPPDVAQRFPRPDGTSRWHMDLWAANARLLMEKGIAAQQIRQAGICTYTHSSQFFSARKLGTNCGRIFNGIMLR